MASPSLVWFHILLLSFVTVMFECSQTCPESFDFSCPDNLHSGLFSSSSFTSPSLRSYNCGGPCELTCNYANHTMIKCNNNDTEQPHRVLEINPTNLTVTIAVKYPDLWLHDLCKAYLHLNSSFHLFHSVSLFITGSGENETFYGCPHHDEYWNSQHKTGCGNAIVYGPYAYGQLPAREPPLAGCMQFLNYFSSPAEHSNTKTKTKGASGAHRRRCLRRPSHRRPSVTVAHFRSTSLSVTFNLPPLQQAEMSWWK